MKAKNIWSANNGCHVSQEDVCKLWAVLYPIFTDTYMKTRFPEEGFKIRRNCVFLDYIFKQSDRND